MQKIFTPNGFVRLIGYSPLSLTKYTKKNFGHEVDFFSLCPAAKFAVLGQNLFCGSDGGLYYKYSFSKFRDPKYALLTTNMDLEGMDGMSAKYMVEVLSKKKNLFGHRTMKVRNAFLSPSFVSIWAKVSNSVLISCVIDARRGDDTKVENSILAHMHLRSPQISYYFAAPKLLYESADVLTEAPRCGSHRLQAAEEHLGGVFP